MIAPNIICCAAPPFQSAPYSTPSICKNHPAKDPESEAEPYPESKDTRFPPSWLTLPCQWATRENNPAPKERSRFCCRDQRFFPRHIPGSGMDSCIFHSIKEVWPKNKSYWPKG